MTASGSADVRPVEQYQQARARARRRPTWWLRRRDRRIVSRQPRPSAAELIELQAIRAVLRVRAIKPCPRPSPPGRKP